MRYGGVDFRVGGTCKIQSRWRSSKVFRPKLLNDGRAAWWRALRGLLGTQRRQDDSNHPGELKRASEGSSNPAHPAPVCWLCLVVADQFYVSRTGVLLRGGTEGARVDNPDLDMTNSFFSFAEWDALRHRLTGRAFIRPFHSHSGIVFAEMIELVCRDMPDFSKVRVWTREDPTCRMSFGGCSWFLGGVGPPEISAWSQPCDDESDPALWSGAVFRRRIGRSPGCPCVT